LDITAVPTPSSSSMSSGPSAVWSSSASRSWPASGAHHQLAGTLRLIRIRTRRDGTGSPRQ